MSSSAALTTPTAEEAYDTMHGSSAEAGRPRKSAGTRGLLTVLVLGAFVALPILEWRYAWGSFSNTGDAKRGWKRPSTSTFPIPLPPLYGLVVLVNVVLCSLVLIFKLGFGIVIKGRREFGYKLPIMHAAQDILQLDVEAGGAIFSNGDAAAAKQRWKQAMDYNCHQRAHHQPLETFPVYKRA